MDRKLTTEQYHDLNNALAILMLSIDQLNRQADQKPGPDTQKILDISSKLERTSTRIHEILKSIQNQTL